MQILLTNLTQALQLFETMRESPSYTVQSRDLVAEWLKNNTPALGHLRPIEWEAPDGPPDWQGRNYPWAKGLARCWTKGLGQRYPGCSLSWSHDHTDQRRRALYVRHDGKTLARVDGTSIKKALEFFLTQEDGTRAGRKPPQQLSPGRVAAVIQHALEAQDRFHYPRIKKAEIPFVRQNGSAYTLKHIIERDLGTYVPMGAVVDAAFEVGLQVGYESGSRSHNPTVYPKRRSLIE